VSHSEEAKEAIKFAWVSLCTDIVPVYSVTWSGLWRNRYEELHYLAQLTVKAMHVIALKITGLPMRYKC